MIGKGAAMNHSFHGKVCVVTGAGSGIGRAIALRLANEGALLAICDIDQAGLQQTAGLASDHSPNRIRSDVFDIADKDAIVSYAKAVKESFGPADYLFNVAGLTRVGHFRDTPLESVEKVMDVNFWGVVRMTKAFLPQLFETKGGIINISSIFGMIGVPGQAHYCASKFAVRGFNESIAAELEEAGVAVTSVHPGGVSTNIARNATLDALPPEFDSRDALIDQFNKFAITSPDKAADIILKGAARRARRVMVGRDARIMSFVQRLFPTSYMRFFQSMVRPRAKPRPEG